MATILKCKMCGGDIEVSPDMTIGTCLYCGSTMTLPRIDGEKKARLFNRANQYRLNNEFDKAYETYKAIVDEDEQESECYWGMLLSEYGVEYVEDPKTGKRIPTCHRTRIQSILNTANFELAQKYADVERRFMYQDEAEIIDAIQKRIIAISANEEPYDVFICYKETDDATGERTADSVIAFDIYETLEKKGIKTFFSRVTLEDKLGQDYEPYIYSALRSARVLLLVTTSSEHAQAVWVKNEWGRYISFMEEDGDKTIIPVYKNMSPYELPNELVRYQSQDISKLGSEQDLLHAVEKLLDKEKKADKLDHMQLSELIEDKQRREAASQRNRRIIVGIVILLAMILFGLRTCSSGSVISNGYNIFSLIFFERRFSGLAVAFSVLMGLSVLCDIGATIIGMVKGFTHKHTTHLYLAGYAILFIGIFFLNINHFRPGRFLWKIVICNTIFVALFLILNIKGKRYSYARSLAAIGVIGCLGSYIWSNNCVQAIDNGENIMVEQVCVTGIYINIRDTSSEEGAKLGEVYKGQYFDVLSQKQEESATWYEIETASGIHGYINGKYTEFSDSLENQINALIDQRKFDEATDLINKTKEDMKNKNNEKETEIEKIDELESKLEETICEADYKLAKSRSLYDYSAALDKWKELVEKNYKDSASQMENLMADMYSYAQEYYAKKHYDEAIKIYSLLAEYDYNDSSSMLTQCMADKDSNDSNLSNAYTAISGKFKAEMVESDSSSYYLKMDSKGTFSYAVGSDKKYKNSDRYTYKYDTANGMYFIHLGSDSYEATLSADGNTLKLVFKGDENDRWMSIAGTYVRVE